MKVRDSQRSKLYKAEHVAWIDRQTRYDDLDACVEYLRKVWTSEWTRSQFDRARAWPLPKVVDGRGTRSATGSIRRINLPRWARTDWVILHECAHALTPERPAHGRAFARTFLALVQHFIGVEAGTALKHAFKAHRVRWRPKRVLTPERLAVLRARGLALAAARKKGD